MASTKLDFRYADEEDCVDIFNLLSNGTNISEILVPQQVIEEDCSRQSARWVVLETPCPDEDVCGCARIIFQESSVRVDVFASIGDNAISNWIIKSLLARIELIARSFGLRAVNIELSVNMSAVSEYLEELGYHEANGYLAVQEDSIGRKKDTMIQVYEKDLHASEQFLPRVLPPTDEFTLEEFGDITLFDSNVTSSANMSDLMENLFSALHTEYPGDI